MTKQIYSGHSRLTDEETNIESCILIKGEKNQREICWTNIAMSVFIQVTTLDELCLSYASSDLPWTLRNWSEMEVRGRLHRK